MSITRRDFLKIATVGGCAAAAAAVGYPYVRRASRDTSPNIVVFLSDTLRADRLGCFGATGNTSPAIDAFANESAVFDAAYAQSPWTKPSVASIFTGLLPVITRVSVSTQEKVQILRDRFLTLPECLREAGYQTAIVSANGNVSVEKGFSQGVDQFLSPYAAVPLTDRADYFAVVKETPAPSVETATDWLNDAERDRPVFLYVHELDPHGPYLPREDVFRDLHGVSTSEAYAALPSGDHPLIDELLCYYSTEESRHALCAETGIAPEGTRLRRPTLQGLSNAGRDFLLQLYDAEIRGTVDNQFGKLLDALDRSGRGEDSIVIFTSDHGEAFGEHVTPYREPFEAAGKLSSGVTGYLHGHSLYDELLHVPLIVRARGLRAAQRIPYSVGLSDLYASCAAAAGAEIPGDVPANPLFDENGQPTVDADRTVFADLDHSVREIELWDTAMIRGRYKVMSADHGKKLLLFDRETDPAEQTNLLDQDPNAHPDLVAAFQLARRDHLLQAVQFGEPEWAELNDRVRENLEALGYL